MSKSLSNLWDYVYRYAYPILFILFALWMCIGIFPLICYESDSQGVLMGCEILYDQGWRFPPICCYEYRMQPLTPITVVALKHLMPFLTCEQIYCLMTALASFIFLIGCIEFARHITKESRTKILIAAMLLPEMYAIAMYPNSAIPAAACFIWAFLNIVKERHWLAILLMCIAPLFRVDVVIVYPAILPLLFFENKSLKKSLILSAVYGVIVIVIGLFLFGILKADVLSAVHGESGYDYWNSKITFTTVLKAIFGFYSLSYLIMLPLGTYQVYRRRAWTELFLILLPIILLHFVYRSMGCASKHYLYIAPFVIIAGVQAIIWISDKLQGKKYLRSIVIFIATLFLICSIRVVVIKNPWQRDNMLYNGGFITSLFSTRVSSLEFTVGIGAGQYVPTLDENMTATGFLFYPYYIHDFKIELNDLYQQIKKELDVIPTSNILTIEQSSELPLLCMYLSEHQDVSFHKDENIGRLYTLKDKERTLTFMKRDVEKKENEHDFLRDIEDIASDLPKGDVYIIVGSARNRYFLECLSKNNEVKKLTEGLYKINRESLQ